MSTAAKVAAKEDFARQALQARPSYVAAADGASIHYKDWECGRPIVFSHGWPLNSDAWHDQLLFFAQNGYRAVAHDRRGHGRSQQASDGNDIDTYADDLATLMDTLDLRDAVLAGHSPGGGEVARYIGRHGTGRVGKLAPIGSITPALLRSEFNPGGSPIEAWDGIRAGLASDRSQFYRDLGKPFFSANRPGSTVSQGVLDTFWLLCMQCGLKAAHECTRVWESDFREDLGKCDKPILVIHGDDDQIVPIKGSAEMVGKLFPAATIEVYAGAPHGLPVTHKDRFNADLLAFAAC